MHLTTLYQKIIRKPSRYSYSCLPKIKERGKLIKIKFYTPYQRIKIDQFLSKLAPFCIVRGAFLSNQIMIHLLLHCINWFSLTQCSFTSCFFQLNFFTYDHCKEQNSKVQTSDPIKLKKAIAVLHSLFVVQHMALFPDRDSCLLFEILQGSSTKMFSYLMFVQVSVHYIFVFLEEAKRELDGF